MGKHSKKARRTYVQQQKINPGNAIIEEGQEKVRQYLKGFNYIIPDTKIDPFKVCC